MHLNVNISEQCQALFARVTAVRLVMEGHLGKDVAKMVNLCRQSAAIYVARFNQGGLD
ncbi:helix-turn-helix domain-containing protein, partial [Anoxybacillus kestanbolensis]|uniref:helix-turn-helix domain-containing protein n=1 Tax=Anoxybacillus kestanbolensis TaxID=227476 RepID=UPI003D1CE2B2